uniref:histone acetyltransferase n=1 Tax=Talaromyces marneffei PM1 TaxID=1077442 RepID=A0A093XDN6_TALMA
MATPRLEDLLAEVLPLGIQLNVRHISTTPTRCEAIFSAPPGQDPELTYCESHFLIVTVNKNHSEDIVDDEIAILGVEVYVYTTDRLTTLFVSKADSTGYVHLSTSRQTTAPKISLLRSLTTTFISFLARSYQRPGVRLVLSLFARAQNQYLFPGSVDNERKHVLDDRGLIKWWCRAADPLLREHTAESRQQQQETKENGNMESVKSSATAYLLVPGCDQYESRAFFPPTARSDDNQNHPRWRVSYPLSQICSHPDAPPRCLVPRFPDDPKARFLDDLDDELSTTSKAGSETDKPGHWRSVRSLEQFWEMMSFRQECSAGRLVGFLWLVINPPGLLSSDKLVSQGATEVAPDTKEKIQSEGDKIAAATTSAEAKFDDRSLPPLQHEKPQPSTGASEAKSSAFYWPEIGRGEIILSEEDYKLANDVLLDQDFETEELAMKGTMAWIRKWHRLQMFSGGESRLLAEGKYSKQHNQQFRRRRSVQGLLFGNGRRGLNLRRQPVSKLKLSKQAMQTNRWKIPKKEGLMF